MKNIHHSIRNYKLLNNIECKSLHNYTKEQLIEIILLYNTCLSTLQELLDEIPIPKQSSSYK